MHKEFSSESELGESSISRRDYPRVGVTLKVNYRLTSQTIRAVEDLVQYDNGGEEPEESSSTKDISGSGICFFSDKLIPIGSILEIRIELPDGDRSIECAVRVERIEELKKDKIYGIGVCFLDMLSRDRARIDRYLRNLISKLASK